MMNLLQARSTESKFGLRGGRQTRWGQKKVGGRRLGLPRRLACLLFLSVGFSIVLIPHFLCCSKSKVVLTVNILMTSSAFGRKSNVIYPMTSKQDGKKSLSQVALCEWSQHGEFESFIPGVPGIFKNLILHLLSGTKIAMWEKERWAKEILSSRRSWVIVSLR